MCLSGKLNSMNPTTLVRWFDGGIASKQVLLGYNPRCHATRDMYLSQIVAVHTEVKFLNLRREL